MEYFLGNSQKYHLHLPDYFALYSKWKLVSGAASDQLLLSETPFTLGQHG